ncbi:putative RNA-directed DNA polymerase, eukaryota, reverse transcriptase zinc-binding domain protein [Tanacetum coccineum]
MIALIGILFKTRCYKWVSEKDGSSRVQTSQKKFSSVLVLVKRGPRRWNSRGVGRSGKRHNPLSPFLYHVHAEGLNVTLKDVVRTSLYKRVKIGTSDIPISHLQYADDTLIFGEWKESNARNLIRIMECVKQASCLKINSNKTKLYGIEVHNEEVEGLANLIGCLAGKMPFTYLGIPIGVNMKNVDSWKVIMEKFKKRLGNWKTKMISCGGGGGIER